MKLKTTFVAAAVLATSLGGCVGDDPPDEPGEAVTDQAVLTNCGSFQPITANDPVVPDKELVIVDLSVVEDPCRTTWTGAGCAAGTLGKWTFGQLMANLAGNADVSSPQARGFVASWLAHWLEPKVVGTDTVAARPAVWGTLIRPWLIASSCVADATTLPAQKAQLLACTTLDLKKAPYRLLGIVNRIDLDGRDYSGNNGAPGELRFAYGVHNTTQAAQPAITAAVILEYQYPTSLPPVLWAQRMHALSKVAFGPAFASQLDSATTNVIRVGAQPGKPNNSALGQIRTNESAFDNRAQSARQWEFRQFALAPCAAGTTCNLVQVPVSQTPSSSANNSRDLTTFMTNNREALRTSRHVVPPTLLGGSSLSGAGGNAIVWNTELSADETTYTLVDPTNKPVSYTARHNFAFSTCNGCHYMETNNQNQQFHLAPRNPGLKSAVSQFLAGGLNPGSVPTDYIQVADPNGDSFDVDNGITLYFQYNEIWRRGCEVRRVLAGVQAPFTTPTGH